MDNKYNITIPQNNIYMVEKFQSGTSINIIAGKLNIKTGFNSKIWNKLLNKLVEDNDALRIKIHEEKNKVYQTVSKYEPEKFEYIDMSNSTEKEIESYMYANIHIPFKFNDSKLYDFKMIKCKGKSGCIFMKFHHIITDAWSLMQIINQLVAMYDEYLNNVHEETEIPSYLEYISKEKEYFESEKYLQDEIFWKDYLKEITYPASIKTTSSKLSNEADRFSVKLNKILNNKINEYCKLNKISPYILFLGALSTYIYRINNNNDFIIGSPILNRSNFKAKQTVGMFVSTIPIRIKMEEEIKFLDLLKQISVDTMSLYRHQKYPITKTLENIHNTTDIKGKIYNVLLSYQNARANIENSKIFSTKWLFSGHIQDELEIHILDMDNEGVFTINYDYLSDLFTKTEIKYLHSRIIAIIENAINDLDVNVEKINIMSEDEERKILYEFNNTLAEYPKDKAVIQIFEERVEKTPDQIAVFDNGNKITYKELNDKANELAEKIKFSGSNIAYTTSRSIEKIITILGIMKSRNTLLPVDMEYPIDRINNMLKISDAKFLIAEKNEVKQVKQKLKKIYDKIVTIDDEIPFDNETNQNNKINENLYLVFTSGSTGVPKGIGITNKNMINLLFSQKRFDMQFENQKVLQFATLSFDVSYQEIFSALTFGGHLVIVNNETKKDAVKLSKYININQIDILFIPPVYLRAICESEENIKNIKNLKAIVVAGEQCIINKNIRNLLKGTNITLYNHYGPAETHVVTIAQYRYKDINKKNVTTISIGKPINNTNVLILDDKNRLLPIGVYGEINIIGDSVGSGYYGNKQLTDNVFSDAMLFGNKTSKYKTGDIGKYEFDSNIYYNGRKDFQIKVNGFRIEIEEIERVTNALKYVNNVAVIITTDKKFRNKINVVIEFNKKTSIEKLKKDISAKLPKYMMPHFYYEIKKMPINFNGKIDRKVIDLSKLKNINVDKKHKEIYDLQTKIIKKTIEQVLNSEIGINDNFFDSGLDSIGAIEFQVKLLKNNIKVSIQEIYDNGTIKKLTSFVTTSHQKEKSNISVLRHTVNKTINSERKIQTIFLTGTTGYLGVHILLNLIKNYKDFKIICLVREKKNNASQRLHQHLSYYSPENIDEIMSRVEICEGNLDLEKFGLDDTKYEKLKNEVDVFVNCAALVVHYADRKNVNASNIESIKNIIEFCRDTNIIFNQISTIGVAGNGLVDNNNCVKNEYDENDLYIGQMYNQNVYVESKLLGENIIYKSIKNGLKANVIRVGNLTNRSTDYLFQKNLQDNAFQNKLLSIMKLGMLPKMLKDLEFDITPVDVCADNVIKIILSNTYNSVYHVFNDDTIKFSELLNYMNKISGKEIKLVTISEFKKNINNMDNNTYFSNLVQDLFIKNSNCIKVLNNITKTKGFCNFNKIDNKYYLEMFERIWKYENNK